jgi:hypothetical protein
MKSRMEKYYNGEVESNERTKKNQQLYDTMYNLDPIANIEDLDNNIEMNLSDINKRKNREDYQKIKEYNDIIDIKKDTSIYDYEQEDQQEEKIYDINSILNKAKERRNDPSNDKYRNLRNTQYDILSKLNIEKVLTEDETDDISDEERLRNLIHTITMNKRELNNLKNDLSLDLLADLKPGTDNTIVTEALIEEKIEITNNNSTNELNDVDKSFYTNSMTFSKQDFEGTKNIEKVVKSNNILIKILIFLLLVIVSTIVMFVLQNYL